MIFATCIISVFSVFAHPGSLDSNGGHWDRKNGTYHFHEGKNTGGSSSSSSKTYKYEPFTPPYEPPTNNPYRIETESSDDESDIKEIISSLLTILICAGIGISFIYYDVSENDGCFTFGLASIVITYLIGYLLNKHPLWAIIGIVTLILFVCLSIRIIKQYSIIETNINNYQKCFINLQNCIDDFVKLENKTKKQACVRMPDLYEIGNDNLPRDKNRTSKWGQTFTLYKTNQGTKLHVKYNCCSAVNPTHVYWHQNYTDFFKLLCKKCAKGYKPPDMSWYKCYLEYERAKEKRKNIETNYKKLHEEIETLHKKCNSLSIKMLIIFSRKNKKALQDTNKKYNELQTKSQLLS